ncbi:MAG: L-ribulose-5-phosphate 4-epimerase [Tepidanaerobacteraceae bacterium]|jgi:L-fuculose-phosphate aldolase/L-ribulose-5-phosphate 4-epimerase|nr:L-ribulose-5-phosphate 4-epimerase [Tepidanaerobacteraceae bacterium]
MLLEKLREEVLEASKKLIYYNLVTLTGGNVSGRDPESGYIAITPSGMEYEKLIPEDIVILDKEGNLVDGKWKPSVDTKAHLYIYNHIPKINSVIHTHSVYASCFSVLNESIPVITTTLANAIGGEVPVAKYTPVGDDNMGPAIVEAIGDRLACLLENHGVMTIGPTIKDALTAAVMLEDVAKIYYFARSIGKPQILPESEVKKARDLYLYVYGQ